MAIDVTTPDGRAREERNASLLIICRNLQRAADELEWLIGATPTSERRNLLTDINIHVTVGYTMVGNMKSEES